MLVTVAPTVSCLVVKATFLGMLWDYRPGSIIFVVIIRLHVADVRAVIFLAHVFGAHTHCKRYVLLCCGDCANEAALSWPTC